MNNTFGTPKTQSEFSLGTMSQPASGGFTFGAATAGAGDASKTATPNFGQTAATPQAKPGGLMFGTNFGTAGTAAPGFGSTPAKTTGFGVNATGTPGFGTSTPGTTGFGGTQPSGTALSLGSTPLTANVSTGGLTFGTPVTAATPAGSAAAANLTFGVQPTSNASIGFGTIGTSIPGTGYSLSGTTTPATSTISFNLGGMQAATGTPQGGLTFGAAKPQTTGTPVGSTATSAPVGLSFGNTPASVSNTGFTTGVRGPATTTSTTGFSISSTMQPGATSVPGGASLSTNPASTASTGFSASGTPAQTVSTTGTTFNLGNVATTTAASATSGFNMGALTSSTNFSLGSTVPTTATAAFGLGGAKPATNTTGFSLGKSTAPVAPSTTTTSALQPTMGTATNVTASGDTANQPAGTNFCQLEEMINKWTLELEEQEKVFVNQATQINAWDRLLITNGEKIGTLNQEVERVKLEQQQLEHELDYVVGQQRELQDCLLPLEKELATVSASDPERDYTYRLAENLDTQLKQMSEDLKEIIEHLNEANRSQDSSDPIVQIGKILNAHMNSLQWLDQRTAILSSKIQQIDQMHQNFRQEHERSFNLAYN